MKPLTALFPLTDDSTTSLEIISDYIKSKFDIEISIETLHKAYSAYFRGVILIETEADPLKQAMLEFVEMIADKETLEEMDRTAFGQGLKEMLASGTGVEIGLTSGFVNLFTPSAAIAAGLTARKDKGSPGMEIKIGEINESIEKAKHMLKGLKDE